MKLISAMHGTGNRCMLQWFGNSDESVIYNDYSTKTIYISQKSEILVQMKRIVHKPIYSVAKTGKFALTLNFERLALMS